MSPRFRAWIVLGFFVVLSPFLAWGGENSPNRPGNGNADSPQRSTAAKSLAPLLKANAEPPRLKLLRGVGVSDLKDGAVLGVLGQFIDRETQARRFSPSLVWAIQLLGRAETTAAQERLSRLLTAHDPRVVMLAADLVSPAQRSGDLETFIKLAGHTDYLRHFGFRRSVVDAVARFRQPKAVDFLVATLGNSQGQLKFETARHLTRLTGQNWGGNAAEWKSWWTRHRGDFQLGRADAESPPGATDSPDGKPSAAMAWPEPVPLFYGVPIYAQRVCFVIDRSKSMSSSVNRETRLDRAVKELEQAINGLSESAHFNIVTFDTEIGLFKRGLIPATASHRREAILFAYGLAPGELTNCHDALMAGLDADPNLEALLFLSDGEPTAGPIIEPFSIVEAVTERNAFQRTTINTIGIDARGQHEEFLKQLAARNCGEYNSAR